MTRIQHAVITGGTRGIGRAIVREFLTLGFHVTASGRSEESAAMLRKSVSTSDLAVVAADVTRKEHADRLWREAVDAHGPVDIWVNNAGINQPGAYVWELPREEVERVVATDLLGVVYGTQVAVSGMLRQGHGAVYNMEGHGSNGSIIPMLSLYGAAKRAVTYLTRATAKELTHAGGGDSTVLVGAISPGIVLTDFTLASLKGDSQRAAKARVAFGVLGELPETVARYLVPRMIANRRNGATIRVLTTGKAFWYFATAPLRKRRKVVEIAERRRADGV